MRQLRFLFLFLAAAILMAAFDFVFVLFSLPQVADVLPLDGERNVSERAVITIRFNKPVSRQELKHLIFPETYGEWKFTDPLIKNHLFKTLTFIPAEKFSPGTQFFVRLENIRGFGLGAENFFAFSFRTAPDKEALAKRVTLLETPLDWQDHKLSCEAASLKMALCGKGIRVSEEEIMAEIGVDTTSRQGKVWGDPYEKFVGEIDGRICQTGYGAYWPAVARAALKWRESESFTNWNLENLINEIEQKNPVVVWGVLPDKPLTDCSWYTREGKYVKAFREAHVRLLIGFVGPADSPSQIILNDPLAGQLYWSTADFLKNWSAFNNSGVAVR
ncbi:MAG: C39 family peptidase [bacterium]